MFSFGNPTGQCQNLSLVWQRLVAPKVSRRVLSLNLCKRQHNYSERIPITMTISCYLGPYIIPSHIYSRPCWQTGLAALRQPRRTATLSLSLSLSPNIWGISTGKTPGRMSGHCVLRVPFIPLPNPKTNLSRVCRPFGHRTLQDAPMACLVGFKIKTKGNKPRPILGCPSLRHTLLSFLATFLKGPPVWYA